MLSNAGGLSSAVPKCEWADGNGVQFEIKVGRITRADHQRHIKQFESKSSPLQSCNAIKWRWTAPSINRVGIGCQSYHFLFRRTHEWSGRSDSRTMHSIAEEFGETGQNGGVHNTSAVSNHIRSVRSNICIGPWPMRLSGRSIDASAVPNTSQSTLPHTLQSIGLYHWNLWCRCWRACRSCTGESNTKWKIGVHCRRGGRRINAQYNDDDASIEYEKCHHIDDFGQAKITKWCTAGENEGLLQIHAKRPCRFWIAAVHRALLHYDVENVAQQICVVHPIVSPCILRRHFRWVSGILVYVHVYCVVMLNAYVPCISYEITCTLNCIYSFVKLVAFMIMTFDPSFDTCKIAKH